VIVRTDVAKVTKLLDQPVYFGSNKVAPANIRQLIYQLPLDIVWGNLGVCGTEVVNNYLLLDAKLDEFAKTQYLKFMPFKMNCRSSPIFWMF